HAGIGGARGRGCARDVPAATGPRAMTTLHRAADERFPGELTLNGQRRSGQAEARMLLCAFLRHELQAFGVHVGCEHGVCGACTILVDGQAVRSCTQYAAQADGADIVTVEGLAPPGTLNE